MEDEQIIQMYFDRDEEAIRETERKYGKLCFQLAYQILGDREDSKECVNDAYFSLWNAIPPAQPENLMAFFCKITKNLSLKRLDYIQAEKRNPNLAVSMTELEDILSDDQLCSGLEIQELGQLLNRFLRGEPPDARRVFIRKYWFFDSVGDIATRYAFSESKVKSMLYRTRNRLKKYLAKEGVAP